MQSVDVVGRKWLFSKFFFDFDSAQFRRFLAFKGLSSYPGSARHLYCTFSAH